ncbi:unnamed protein product, partial [Ixodes hexagonus]
QKFRLFGKKKSQPAQLDPNCPQCNPHLLAALEARRREQLEQQQSMAEKPPLKIHYSTHRPMMKQSDIIPGGVVEDDDDTLSLPAEERLPCDCHKCQQARSERPLTVELLPMDTQLPLQNMMQDAAFMCVLL